MKEQRHSAPFVAFGRTSIHGKFTFEIWVVMRRGLLLVNDSAGLHRVQDQASRAVRAMRGMLFNPGEIESLLTSQTNPLVWLDGLQLQQIAITLVISTRSSITNVRCVKNG